MLQQTQETTGISNAASLNGTAPADTSSVDPSEVVPTKIHVRGLDNLSQKDIEDYTTEHSHPPSKIEWINDTSANMLYETPEQAIAALQAFSDVEITAMPHDLQLRQAKGFSIKPDARLEARIAIVGDKKQPGARDRSRYYLFHPDQDPAEKKSAAGKRRERRTRYRDYEDTSEGDYRRRRFDDREHRRRREENATEGFDASQYDDDDTAIASRDLRKRGRRLRSHSDRSSESPRHGSSRREQFGSTDRRELFPNREAKNRMARLRNRSASPIRDRDGDENMADDNDRISRRHARQRSYTPPPPYSEKPPTDDLVPRKVRSKKGSRELGAELTPLFNQGKELFAMKMTPTSHHRSHAFDAADETADLFAGRMSVPFTDGSTEMMSSSRSLADRITKSDGSKSLADRITFPDSRDSEEVNNTAGFSIHGASRRPQAQGMSIRGLAEVADQSLELFPSKLNANKELFSEKLVGRGGARKRAQDYSY